MRLVTVAGKAVELNYMWLPTWLGQNLEFKKWLEKEMKGLVVGQPLTDETLDRISEQVHEKIVEKYPIEGLWDYLDGLKFVKDIMS